MQWVQKQKWVLRGQEQKWALQLQQEVALQGLQYLLPRASLVQSVGCQWLLHQLPDQLMRGLPQTNPLPLHLQERAIVKFHGAAHMLKIPLGTVQSRIHRATSLLKITLTAEAELSQKETYHVV